MNRIVFAHILLIGLANCGSLFDGVYIRLSEPSGTACYRILNGTHQFGCPSSKADGVGVVVKFDGLKDLSAIRNCWRDRFINYDGGFFLMLDITFLIPSVIEEIRGSNCIRGLLLTDSTSLSLSTIEPLSDDSSCPNVGSSFYSDSSCEENAWNKDGATIPTGLRNIDWKKQILMIKNKTEVDIIEKCHSMFNVGSNLVYPYCAISFAAVSTAAGNSEICRRRSMPNSKLVELNVEGTTSICDEISGQSVVAFIPPRPNSRNNSVKSSVKYLLLGARIDSFGLIPEVSPGDFSVMTSLIALLASARGVGLNYEAFEGASNRTGNHLLFTFFNGESFDYVGSSSIMYHAQQGEFPQYEKGASSLEQIRPEQIVAVVEPQHIGITDELHAVVDGHDFSEKSSQVNHLVDVLKAGVLAQNGSLVNPVEGGRMPPSVWQTLKKFNKDAIGVVLAPFSNKYTYKRINSVADKIMWTDQETKRVKDSISKAASALMYAAADHVGLSEESKRGLTVDQLLISQLFDCLLKNQVDIFDCPFIQNMNSSEVNVVLHKKLSSKTTYVGASIPNNMLDPNPLRAFTYLTSIYATGSISHTGNVKDEKTCRDLAKGKLYNYEWMQDPETLVHHCYRHNVFNFATSSPAFLIPDYDFSNSTFSTWTESLYNYDSGVQLFLIENKSFECIILFVGIAVAFLSMLIVGRCSEDTFIVDEGERSAAMGEPL